MKNRVRDPAPSLRVAPVTTTAAATTTTAAPAAGPALTAAAVPCRLPERPGPKAGELVQEEAQTPGVGPFVPRSSFRAAPDGLGPGAGGIAAPIVAVAKIDRAREPELGDRWGPLGREARRRVETRGSGRILAGRPGAEENGRGRDAPMGPALCMEMFYGAGHR